MWHLKRHFRPIQLFYSHINRAQTVTTWSHLANHFNSKPEDDRWSFLKCERTVSISIDPPVIKCAMIHLNCIRFDFDLIVFSYRAY